MRRWHKLLPVGTLALFLSCAAINPPGPPIPVVELPVVQIPPGKGQTSTVVNNLEVAAASPSLHVVTCIVSLEDGAKVATAGDQGKLRLRPLPGWQ